jgi:CSLREA domain-containing protein
VTRRLLVLAVLAAVLAAAPAAHAADFVVNSTADTGDTDATADGACDSAGGDCTLREAVFESSATAATDRITFTVGAITVASTLEAGDGCPSTCPVAITGPVTLRLNGIGPLLLVESDAAGSSLASLTLTRTAGTGPLLRLEGATTVSGSSVTGAAGDGIEVVTSGVAISNTTVSGNGGDGVDFGGTASTVRRSAIFNNGGAPIANAPVAAPQGLRIGPRRADGTLPLTGSTDGGTLDLFSGNAFGSSAISFLGELELGPGGFAHVISPEPAPFTPFSATVTNGGTSGFATATVPFDVVSPDVVGAVATSTTQVRVQLSEPLDPASIGPEDFQLEMAEAQRAITAVALDATGANVFLTSSGWASGEAGFVQVAGPGAFTDAAGNAGLTATRVRVAAAPGDFFGPVASSLSIRPRAVCLTRSRTCRRTGARVRFISSEPGRARLVIMRGNRRVGEDIALVEAGRNTVRFNGRLRGRKLRAGSYRMLLYIEDAVGNETEEPPIQRFTVRRTTR